MAVTSTAARAAEPTAADYRRLLALAAQVEQHFYDVVKLELAADADINDVQAMMLYNIGDATMTVGELTLRGCYLGSNVSYNVKKMVENGYLIQERSLHDRRSLTVRLTDKGREVNRRMEELHSRHFSRLYQGVRESLPELCTQMQRLDRFLVAQADHLASGRQVAA